MLILKYTSEVSPQILAPREQEQNMNRGNEETIALNP